MQLYHGRMTEHPKIPAPKWLSRQEAAIVLGVPLATVDRMIRRGLLDRYRVRGLYVRVRAGQVAELAHLPREWLTHC